MAGDWKKRASQFFFVLKKNFLLQWRRPASTTLELLCPAVAIALLIILRHTVPLFKLEQQCFVTFDSDHLVIPYTGNYTIYYTPDTPAALSISSIIQSKLQGANLISVQNETVLVRNIQHDEDSRQYGCFINGTGIIFNNLDDEDMEYTLRLRHETPTKDMGANKWFTQLRAPGLQTTGPRVYDNAYLNEGFLHLENIVGQALIEWKTGVKPNLPPVNVRQLPYPTYNKDEFLVNVDFILPFLMMAAFMVSAGFLTKELVLEKESRIRETMKMMGLSNWVLWTTWYLKQFIFLMIPFLIFGALLSIGQIFPHSNIAALLIFMVTYLFSLLSFCFLISVWFNDSTIGLMAGFIFWFLTYFPHFFLAFYYDSLPLPVKVISCFLSNSCMGLAVNVISVLELRGDGLQFNNIAEPLSLDDEFNMLWIIMMLLFDSLLYLLVASYVNEVKPGAFGIPRKPYFFLLPSYWSGNPQAGCYGKKGVVCPTHTAASEEADIGDSIEECDGPESPIHERIIPEPPIGIEITNLLKRFKPGITSFQSAEVVNIRKLKIYRGQITALLGHNGAGKTTTMSMMTGLYPPTSGSIVIGGHDVKEDIDIIRQDLGVCPQNNVLFDRMTVKEHLWYFAKLKGIAGAAIHEAVSTMTSKMDLTQNLNKRASALSGGNKRKLSVAIAMIGDPSVVILDEPTSGMDNIGRELTWKLLRERAQSKNATVLVSTHNMDDTERADRIVIMVYGRVRCSGRPPFLKEKYGVGYNLRIQLSNDADPQQLEDLVSNHIQQYKLYSFVRHHEYTLPYDEMKKFPRLFKLLEARRHELGIISFSMQENSMEDVFISAKEGVLLPMREDSRRRSAIIHHPTTLPRDESFTSFSPSLFEFSGTSDELANLFQGVSSPTQMEPIEEESMLQTPADEYGVGIEETDSPSRALNDVPLGFPAVDRSLNAKEFYAKKRIKFALSQQQSGGSIPDNYGRRSRSSSGADESALNQDKQPFSSSMVVSAKRSTTVSHTGAVEKGKSLFNRPSILENIVDEDGEDVFEESEEEFEQELQGEEEVDTGGEYTLIKKPSKNKMHACREPELHAGKLTRVCNGSSVVMTLRPGIKDGEHDPSKCSMFKKREDL